MSNKMAHQHDLQSDGELNVRKTRNKRYSAKKPPAQYGDDWNVLYSLERTQKTTPKVPQATETTTSEMATDDARQMQKMLKDASKVINQEVDDGDETDDSTTSVRPSRATSPVGIVGPTKEPTTKPTLDDMIEHPNEHESDQGASGRQKTPASPPKMPRIKWSPEGHPMSKLSDVSVIRDKVKKPLPADAEFWRNEVTGEIYADDEFVGLLSSYVAKKYDNFCTSSENRLFLEVEAWARQHTPGTFFFLDKNTKKYYSVGLRGKPQELPVPPAKDIDVKVEFGQEPDKESDQGYDPNLESQPKEEKITSPKEPECSTCGGPHHSRDCPRCTVCHGFGHVSSSPKCPKYATRRDTPQSQTKKTRYFSTPQTSRPSYDEEMNRLTAALHTFKEQVSETEMKQPVHQSTQVGTTNMGMYDQYEERRNLSRHNPFAPRRSELSMPTSQYISASRPGRSHYTDDHYLRQAPRTTTKEDTYRASEGQPDRHSQYQYGRYNQNPRDRYSSRDRRERGYDPDRGEGYRYSAGYGGNGNGDGSDGSNGNGGNRSWNREQRNRSSRRRTINPNETQSTEETLVEILRNQHDTQLETSRVIASLLKTHEEREADHIVDDIPKFGGNPDDYFDWLLTFETLVDLAGADPRRVVLRKVEGPVLKCVKNFPPATRWSVIKAELRRHFSHVPTMTHANVQLLERKQEIGETLHDYSYNFTLLALAATNRIPSQITDPTKIICYIRGLYNVSIRNKVGRKVHRNLQNCMDYAHQCDKQLLLVEGLGSTETKVLNIQATRRYNTRSQGKVPNKPHNQDNGAKVENVDKRPDPRANVTCYTCGEKGHYSYECPHRQGTATRLQHQTQDDTLVTLSQSLHCEDYKVPSYTWANVMKELWKSKMRYKRNIPRSKPQGATQPPRTSKPFVPTSAQTANAAPVIKEKVSMAKAVGKPVRPQISDQNVPGDPDFEYIDIDNLSDSEFTDEMVHAIMDFNPDSEFDSEDGINDTE